MLEKSLNEDINDFDYIRDAKLDCDDVSHSNLSERKESFVALKAYDEMVFEICSSLWELLISGTDGYLIKLCVLKDSFINFLNLDQNND